MHLSLAERVRALFQEPFASVRAMGVSEGMTVVDIGSGIGYFTVPAALVAGEKGLVYAVEPDPARSSKVEGRVRREGLGNVRVITSGAECMSDVPSGSVDLAFSAFTMHHFEDRGSALREVKRILKDGGKFYLWDRIPGRVVKHGTKPDQLEEISAGFEVERLSTKGNIRARFTKRDRAEPHRPSV